MYLVNGLLTLEERGAFWQKFNWDVQIPAGSAEPASCAHNTQNVHIINISTDLFCVSECAQARKTAPHKHQRMPHIHQNIRERPSCAGRIAYTDLPQGISLIEGMLVLFSPSWQFNVVCQPQITRTFMLIGPSCGVKRHCSQSQVNGCCIAWKKKSSLAVNDEAK